MSTSTRLLPVKSVCVGVEGVFDAGPRVLPPVFGLWLVKFVCVGVGVGVVFDVGAPCIAAGIFGLKMDQKEKLSEPQASFFLSHF